MRATDEMVRTALTWARNYEEIVGFDLVASSGRKWRVELHSTVAVGSAFLARPDDPRDVVPDVLVLTSREALAFAYGCAVGGERVPRGVWRKEWGWTNAR